MAMYIDMNNELVLGYEGMVLTTDQRLTCPADKHAKAEMGVAV